VLNQKVTHKSSIWNVIISIILENAGDTEIQDRQYYLVQTVLSVLSLLCFLYSIYYLMIIGCALSDQCYNDWAGY
jgi:hypothetical protein